MLYRNVKIRKIKSGNLWKYRKKKKKWKLKNHFKLSQLKKKIYKQG